MYTPKLKKKNVVIVMVKWPVDIGVGAFKIVALILNGKVLKIFKFGI